MANSSYVYVSEISLPSHRGLFSSLGSLLVSLSVLFVYYMGYLFHWTIVCYFCALTAFISFLLVFLIPETPAWYASKALVVKSEASLNWLRKSSRLVNAEMKEILESISDDRKEEKKTCWEMLKEFAKPAVWKPFFILFGYFTLQQASGMFIIVFYAVGFFQKVGSSMDAWTASISVAVMRLVMSVIGSACILYFGRKPLAMISGFGMALTMGTCGFYEHYFKGVPVADRSYSWFPFVCILMNVSANMLGTVQLPWLLTGELFPLSVRGFMQGITSCIAYLLCFIFIKIYPSLLSHIQIHDTMYIFSIASTGIILLSLFILPETKGKTLLEVEKMFQGDKLPFSSIDQFVRKERCI